MVTTTLPDLMAENSTNTDDNSASPPQAPPSTADEPTLDFSDGWYDRPTQAQPSADGTADDGETFEAVFEKIQKRDDWRERLEEHVNERLRGASDQILEQARRERASLEESNTKRAAALEKAAAGYRTLAGRVNKLVQDQTLDADTLQEVFSSVPDLADNFKLISEEYVTAKVEERLKTELEKASVNGAWSGLLWGLENGLKAVGLSRLWGKQKAAFEGVKSWDDVATAVGATYKAALEAAYKRGVNDARAGTKEVVKANERSSQGPVTSSGSTGRFKSDDDILAPGSNASAEEVKAAYKRKYGIDPPI